MRSELLKSLKEFESRVEEKICQDFTRAVSGILEAFSKLEENLLISLFLVQSRNIPGISWVTTNRKQEYYEDRSRNDSHPEMVEVENKMPHTINFESNSIHHKYNKIFQDFERNV